MTPLAAIAELLRTRVGLDPRALGTAALAHAVRRRAKARGLDGAAAYLDAVRDDTGEWDALLETVVVPETWFFRDREPFALLARWAARAYAQRSRHGPLAVLSLPCATGEEAWSIAIALAAAGLPASAFRIDARDLSPAALAVARAGIYPPRALRGHRLDAAWAPYLHTRADGSLEVSAELRTSVHFARANLVEARNELTGGRFDCIFSRNLLIYCDAVTRAAALATFTEVLRPDGLLFLGHAESLPARTAGFVRESPLRAFAWRRTDDPPAAKHPPLRAVSRSARGAPPRARASGASGRHVHAHGTARTRSAHAAVDLARARQLADGGDLAAAASLAAARIEHHPADAPAHALLGIVRAAQGRDGEAAQHLRRALYLEPEREEALVHLALVLERRGDTAAAARLRARARRVEGAR